MFSYAKFLVLNMVLAKGHGMPIPEIKEEQRCSCAHSTLYVLELYQYQERNSQKTKGKVEV